MGSKKHKKHKEKTFNFDDSVCEQKPLKLVLKVGSTTTGGMSIGGTVGVGIGSSTLEVSDLNSYSNYNNISNGRLFTDSKKLDKKLEEDVDDLTHSLSNTFETFINEDNNLMIASESHHGLSKKLKKKKSKKKHKKHSHHHSHHHHHHHHHHRRRSSCSHHSKSSSTQVHQESLTTTTNNNVEIKPNNDVISENGEVTITPLVKSPQKPLTNKVSNRFNFQHFLSHLLKQLQRRDTQAFFAWPVTDIIAPGYSTIIPHPMDFSTMKKKIEQCCYDNIHQFRSDVKLICDNAMFYNRPDTIYYKAARKLWHYAKYKVFSKTFLSENVKSYPELSLADLGYDLDETNQIDVDNNSKMEVDNNSFFTNRLDATRLTDRETIHETSVDERLEKDDLTAEQILEQARKAAKHVADRLTLEKPQGSHLSFLRQQEDGTTTLGILGNTSCEKVVKLESLVGKLTEGTASLATFEESESNKIKPIQSVHTLPFSSYLPSIDSLHSNLNQEETSLLLATYGDDELSLQYSQSLLQFASGNDYALHMVDSLLDVLTQGQHSKTLNKLKEVQKEQQEKERREEAMNEEMNQKSKEKQLDQELVLELDDLNESSDDLQSKLDKTNTLLSELASVQNQRLCSSTQPIKPSKDEQKLADILTSKLTELINNYATPGEVSDSFSIRKAMGIQVKSE